MRALADNRTAPALLWGASAGLLTATLTAVVMWIGSLFFNDHVTISPVFFLAILVILLVWFAPGIAAGVTAHVLLLRTGGAPRLTWFILTVLFVATNLLAMIVARPIVFAFLSQAPSAVQVLSPIVQAITAFGLWFFLATFGLRKALALAEKDDRRSMEAAPSIAGQLALVLFIIMSYGPGIGTLTVGIAVGLPGMLILAALATARRERGRRSGAFLLRVWSTPLVTVTLGIPILIMLLG